MPTSDVLSVAYAVQLEYRVDRISKKLNDVALSWRELEDGSVVIVFSNSGKRTFPPEEVHNLDPIIPIIKTKEDAVTAVARLSSPRLSSRADELPARTETRLSSRADELPARIETPTRTETPPKAKQHPKSKK